MLERNSVGVVVVSRKQAFIARRVGARPVDTDPTPVLIVVIVVEVDDISDVAGHSQDARLVELGEVSVEVNNVDLAVVEIDHLDAADGRTVNVICEVDAIAHFDGIEPITAVEVPVGGVVEIEDIVARAGLDLFDIGEDVVAGQGAIDSVVRCGDA